MNREKTIVTTSLVGIGANFLLVIGKALIGVFANSISIIMDAVNNLSDVLSSVITIIGTKLAGKKPDKKHPFGHGRIEYVTSMIIAMIIFIAGITAIYESITSLINKAEASYTNISLIIISIAVLVKVALGLFYRKMGKKTNSDALKGSGIDALFDALLSFSTLVGALISMFAGVHIEGYLGIVIGLFIIKAGVDVFRGAISNIIGERTSEAISLAIRKAVCQHEGVMGAYDLILNNYGPNKSIGSIHIEVDDNMTAKEIHKLSKEISTEAYLKFGTILTVGIYASNNNHPEMKEIRSFVYELVRSYEQINEIHAFYVDDINMIISFDLIVSFKEENPEGIVNEIKAKIESKYPNYKCTIVLDADFTD